MTRSEKLLQKAIDNPGGLKLRELETLMKQCGWEMDHQRGSHRIWLSKNGFRLPIQNKDGKAKGYQVKQFLKQLEMEAGHER